MFFSRLIQREDVYNSYLTFRPLSGSTGFGYVKKGTGDDLEYSLDEGMTWKSLPPNTIINVSFNETIMWRGNITPKDNTSDLHDLIWQRSLENNNLYNPDIVWITDNIVSTSDFASKFGSGSVEFRGNNKYEAYGNPASILDKDNFKSITDLTNYPAAFANFFNVDATGRNNIISVKNLYLPFTTLSPYCFSHMFYYCVNLIDAPVLPATNLAEGCYAYMFCNCVNLNYFPELPATNLAEACYAYMFACRFVDNVIKRVQIITELPATNLAERCYYGMFIHQKWIYGNLKISATTMAKESCCRMFIDCCWGGSVTVDMNSIETLADGCCAYMFCKSDVMMPDLVAEDLCDRCYYGMFAQCYGFAANRSSSFSILATTKNGIDCTKSWFGQQDDKVDRTTVTVRLANSELWTPYTTWTIDSKTTDTLFSKWNKIPINE